MASMPMDQEHEARRGGGKPPVSAHPAFPAIVALWFAALLGLGSLILPVQLIERVVSATGIASLIPAAAPPLGFTARAAIALVATIFGALLGVVAAKRVANASRNRDDDIGEATGARRAFSAHDDLEEDGIEAEEFYPDADYAPDEESGQRKRRRALAMEEEEGPSDFLSVAPLPGVEEGDAGLDLMEEALELEDEVEFTDESEPDVPAPEPVDGPVEAPPAVAHQEFVAPEDSEEAGEEPQPFAFRDRSNTAEPLAFSPPSMARQTPAQAEAAPRLFDTPSASDEATEAQAEMPEEPQEDLVSDKQTFQPAVPQPFEAPREAANEAEIASAETPQEDMTPPAAPTEAQGDSVGLVQLVQKLGDALDKHREWSAQRAAEAAAAPQPAPANEAEASEAAPSIPQDFEAARPDDAAEAMAAYFSRPAEAAPTPVEDEMPDADQPAPPAPIPGQQFAPLAENMRIRDEDDEDEMDDLAASFALPLTRAESPIPPSVTPTPRPSFDIPPPDAAAAAESEEIGEDEEEEETSPQSDAAYSSLSSVNNPFKQDAQQFVRIDEPEPDVESVRPAVVFPHQETRMATPAPAPVEEVDAQEAPASNVARPFDRPADAPAPVQAPQTDRQPANSDDNERALREALMNLQRMGK
ncbi:hypothetical protein [Aurantiacibacter sp. D1-12]|uniref:hypothetical protein n=1 Tax=Aurantiacibacter sp. D1-12 TaxID=2993658 RepID=UPI00237C6FE0|nr:hypothetical protein [Aurantiacibacter sp. D1-12]MDE1467430.1 hypothetical protein [Aurantiacibacter sp. D1-12]